MVDESAHGADCIGGIGKSVTKPVVVSCENALIPSRKRKRHMIVPPNAFILKCILLIQTRKSHSKLLPSIKIESGELGHDSSFMGRSEECSDEATWAWRVWRACWYTFS